MTHPDAREDLPPNAYLILFALWLMVFSSGSQVMLIAPIFPRIREQLGIAEHTLGTLVAVDAVMLGAVALIAGPISDRFGRRAMLLWGSGVLTIALALHALAFDYASLLIVRGLAGAAGGVLSGAAVAYIGDYFPYHRRGWANGWVMTGMAFGQIIGIPAGTVLASQLGFRIPYIVFAAATAATFLLVLRVVPQPAGGISSERLSVGRAIGNYAELLRTPAILAAVLVFAVTFLANSMFILYLPTWLEESVHATPGQVASLFFAGGIANVLTGPRAGRFSDRVGRKRVIAVSSVALAVLIFAITYVTTSVLVGVALFAVIMMFFASRVGPFQALLTQLVPGERRGSLMSLTVGIGQLGFAFGGAAAGFTYAHFGFRVSTWIAAALMLSTGWIVWQMLPEPDLHAAPPAPRGGIPDA